MREIERAEFATMLTGVLDVFGAKATHASISVWWAALARYSLADVRAALSAHVQDMVAGKFAPKPADIIGRMQLQDGRPGPEEAWSQMPRDEATTVVWTDEMAAAWGVALPLLAERDQVAARMAFVERYRQLVQHARDAGESAKWTVSLGTDVGGREAVLLDAVDRGRLPAQYVAGLLPYRERPNPRLAAMIAQTKALTCR